MIIQRLFHFLILRNKSIRPLLVMHLEMFQHSVVDFDFVSSCQFIRAKLALVSFPKIFK